MPLVTNGQNASCDGIAAVVTHISLHSAFSDTGTSELTGGSPAYARKAVTWAASASGTKANSATLTFDVPPSTTVTAFGMWSALTAGTFYGWMPLNPGAKGFATADTTTDLITSYAHGLTANTAIFVDNVFAESLPTGLARNAVYYVASSGLTADSFRVSTTVGGAVVDITASGELYFQSVVPETFASQGTLAVSIGGLVIDATGI